MTRELKTEEQRVHEALGGLINYVHGTPGAVGALTLELTLRTGSQQFRQNVSEWISPDPQKRRQPRFGIGLVLLDIWDDICAGRLSLERERTAKKSDAPAQ